MCYSLFYVLECTNCGYRQSLGRPVRMRCKDAVEGKACSHRNLEHLDQHVCGSCLLEKEKEEIEKAKEEKKSDKE